MKIDKIKKCLRNPHYLFIVLSYLGFFKNMDDLKYLKKVYKIRTGSNIDFNNPQTFNEKIQWLKLYNRKPEYTTMVDKYAVKKYVADKIGKKYIIPTLGVWEHFDEIDFDKLPNQFVLKCTHDSGGLAICRDKSKFDFRSAKHKIEKSLKRNYYYAGREWPYKNVQPRIIAEKYMVDENVEKYFSEMNSEGLIDYKFYCFNGKPKFLYVGYANIKNGVKHDVLTYLTLDWKIAPFYRKDHENLPNVPNKPECYDEMLEYAEKLSKNIPFVRIDFFVINKIIYFSEYTFSPGAGYGEFSPVEWERKLGDMIELPHIRKK